MIVHVVMVEPKGACGGCECLIRPDFYKSIGKNVDACIGEAQVVFFQKILTPATKEK